MHARTFLPNIDIVSWLQLGLRMNLNLVTADNDLDDQNSLVLRCNSL